LFYPALLYWLKNEKKTEFNKFVDNYYEEGLLFNPIAATQRGDNRYNDLLPNDIAAPYLKATRLLNINIKTVKSF
jgi:hypothetical protein